MAFGVWMAYNRFLGGLLKVFGWFTIGLWMVYYGFMVAFS